MVDDDPLVRDLLRAVLSDQQYDLDEAADGDEAIRIASERAPDIVVLDVMMPGTSGLDVCRAMRADPLLRGSKIVMLTARGTPADRAEGMRAGADAYFTKPFSPLDLIESITANGGKRRG